MKDNETKSELKKKRKAKKKRSKRRRSSKSANGRESPEVVDVEIDEEMAEFFRISMEHKQLRKDFLYKESSLEASMSMGG